MASLNEPEAVPSAGPYGYDTDDENQGDAVLRPSPVSSDAAVFARDLNKDTDAEVEDAPTGGNVVSVKKEYDYDTEDDVAPVTTDALPSPDSTSLPVANPSVSNDAEDEQRPRKKSKKFQRQNGLMVWARDSDAPKAEPHLAYLDDVDEGGDDDEHVWIRWDSDIGRKVRVPRSRIDKIEDAFQKMYAWCESPNYTYVRRMYILPYDRFLFWRKLKKCKTWGEIRALSDHAFCDVLKDRYGRKYDEEDVANLADDTEIDINEDFDLQEHGDYGDCTPYGSFPPLIDEIMYTEAMGGNLFPENRVRDKHGWITNYGEVNGGWYVSEIGIDMEEKEAIFEDMRKHDRAAIHCPELSRLFPNLWDW